MLAVPAVPPQLDSAVGGQGLPLLHLPVGPQTLLDLSDQSWPGLDSRLPSSLDYHLSPALML